MLQSRLPRSSTQLEAVMPAAFVLLWSTGFIGTGIAMHHAEPATFVAVRMAFTAALLGASLVIWTERWPGWRVIGHSAVAGILLHAVYLTAISYTAHVGMPVAIAALVAGMQPLVTGVLAGPLLGERVTRWQWLGLLLGLAGVVMVLWERLGVGEVRGDTLLAAALALAGITFGTLYQKRFAAGVPMRTGTTAQFVASALALAPVSLAFETGRIDWTADMIAAFLWLNLALSIGAIGLLLLMIRRGQATRVVSLFYLTPCVTALMAWGVFGNHLGVLAIAGMAVALVGVALARGRA